MASAMNIFTHLCAKKHKLKMQNLILSYLSQCRYVNTAKSSRPLLNWTNHFLKRAHELSVPQRSFSRTSKSWFRSRKKAYSIVQVHEVSERRSIPAYVPKPDYADSGIANEPDSIQVMNENDVKCMRQSCALAKVILEEVAKHVRAGVSTEELDAIAHNLCIHHEAYPSPLNYRGYPKSICTSVNNIACHGIPDSRTLLDGDIISIDISVYHNGYHGDCAATYAVGKVDEKGLKLMQVASECLNAAIKICRPDQKICQIGKTIDSFAGQHGFSVIPAFCGHGIGKSFHTPPNILHFDNDEDDEMKNGMIFTIEPVICEGQPDIVILEDGWTAATEDDSRSAQFEHTILITDNGAEVLTVSTAFKNSGE